MSTKPEPSYFTKYLFKTGLECPTRLYYNAQNYPENQTPIPFISHLRYNKKMLTRLARSQFPDGVDIESDSIEGAAALTAENLNSENTVLFDALFIIDSAMAKVPLLKKEGHQVTLYEVQTKTFNPYKHRLINHRGNIYSKWKDYLMGLAYKYHIISQLYAEWEIHTVLVLPQKQAVAGINNLHKLLQSGDINNKELSSEYELLCSLDVDKEIGSILAGREWNQGSDQEGKSFAEVFDAMNAQFQSGEKYQPELGYKCKNCAFNLESEEVKNGNASGFDECASECLGGYSEESPKVFDLIGPGTKKWIEQGVYCQMNIPEDEVISVKTITGSNGGITERYRQSLQIMKAKGKEIPEEIIRPDLFHELERWEYPIHFLDFEAGNYAVPLREGRKPYHLVVFQYSCHTLHEDGSLEHHQWIDPMDGGYPNFELIRNLRLVPNILQGTIVQYSEFERYALKVIRKELWKEEQPDGQVLLEWIEEIIGRHDSTQREGPYLADLSRLVKNFYYNHHMQNSLSIKDVLQSVMAQSEKLKELYSAPYQSSNYSNQFWWQKNGSEVMNPYELLSNEQERNVQRGTEAMVAYAKSLSGQLSEAEKDSLKNNLLRYCELDTLAMVMIYQHWNHLPKSNSGTSRD